MDHLNPKPRGRLFFYQQMIYPQLVFVSTEPWINGWIYERDLHLPILQEIHDPWEGETANHQPAPNEGSASCSSRVGLKHGRSKSLKLVAMVLVGVL